MPTAVVSEEKAQVQVEDLAHCQTVAEFRRTARDILLDCNGAEQAKLKIDQVIDAADRFQRQKSDLFESLEARGEFRTVFLFISSSFRYRGPGALSWDQAVRRYLSKSGVKNFNKDRRRSARR